MKFYKYITLIVLTCWISSCKKFMEPQLDNYKSLDYVLNSKNDFLGVLYNTYIGLPTRISFTYEAATDNAIANSDNTTSSKGARGGVSAQSNPFGDNWGNDYSYINKLNWYITHMVLDNSKAVPTPVKFDINAVVNLQTFYFTLGEAYFMRAWYQFDLLQKYGGVGSDGKAYGFPISKNYLLATDVLDLPRNTYQECANQIGSDCDSAVKYLPMVYSKTSGTRPDGLVTDAGHASGIAAKALKARTFLYAASPAYNLTNDASLWDKAAAAAGDAITFSNGISPAIGFDNLLTFANYFNKNNLNNNNYTNKDIFFRGQINTGVTTYESENFPPRANAGRGSFNPTQNLVDAFPMVDGYPRGTSPTKTYDPNNVATNRDPRMDLFIVRNGESIFALPTAVNTLAGGTDAYGSDVNATRSGYYLQKLLDPSVSLKSGSVVTTTFAAILLGKPELYLNFAEAAIHVTGNPDTKIYGYSAREVLAKIRNRSLGAGDVYLPTVSSAAGLLNLILTERRIELCFEDFRFWDLRRLSNGVTDLTALNAPVFGIYSANPVETRSYKSPYMPMPYSEMLKTTKLVNNAGW